MTEISIFSPAPYSYRQSLVYDPSVSPLPPFPRQAALDHVLHVAASDTFVPRLVLKDDETVQLSRNIQWGTLGLAMVDEHQILKN